MEKMRDTARNYLRWSIFGIQANRTGETMQDRSPMVFDLMQAFDQGGCQMLSGAGHAMAAAREGT